MSDDRAAKLAALRARVDQILARPAAPPRPAADPSEGELPFVLHETEHGPLYRRIVRCSATHRVGRFSTRDARDADASMLALLALDPALASLDPADFLYLDTETTGTVDTRVFLLGMARYERDAHGHSLVLEQIIVRHLDAERPLLERLVAEIRRASCLVSYNGKSFDLPRLLHRLELCELDPPPARPHLDLVHLARRVHRDRLGPCRLADLEARVLGTARVVDTPSGQVTATYRHFLQTGDPGALIGVVEHNAQDVLALAALVGIYGAPGVNLPGRDLVGVARTLRRARALAEADAIADTAVAQGGGPEAHKERAFIARARGERDRAVLDLQTALASLDDPDARLALAKLYEHHVRAPQAALDLIAQGTTEDEPRSQHRKQRLERKASAQQKDPPASAVRRKRSRRAPAPLLPVLGVDAVAPVEQVDELVGHLGDGPRPTGGGAERQVEVSNRTQELERGRHQQVGVAEPVADQVRPARRKRRA